MGEVKPDPDGGVWPTVNLSITGGASGVFQTTDTTKALTKFLSLKISQVLQSTSENNAKGDKWDLEEDMALTSTWCVASKHQIRSKKQRKTWPQAKKLYDEAQAKKLKPRTEKQMNVRWRRLNENAIKWINAYRKAYTQKTSEMSPKDVENEAHKIYASYGSKYNDLIVFNEVMCKHPNWKLSNDHGECEMGDDESYGSTKRTMTTEEVDYCVISNKETPDSGDATIQRGDATIQHLLMNFVQ